jgi:hypothetical protein
MKEIGKDKCYEENLPQIQFIYNKYHMNSSAIELDFPQTGAVRTILRLPLKTMEYCLPSLSRRMPGWYIKIGPNRVLPVP